MKIRIAISPHPSFQLKAWELQNDEGKSVIKESLLSLGNINSSLTSLEGAIMSFLEGSPL